MASTLPAAIDALIAALRAVMTDVDVIDGPDISAASLSQAVNVGYQDTNHDLVAAQGEMAVAGFAVSPQRDSYTISCAASAFTGATNDMGAARTAAFALYDRVGQVLAADKTLGGAVMQATPGPWTVTQQATQTGWIVRVLFSVNCDAFT